MIGNAGGRGGERRAWELDFRRPSADTLLVCLAGSWRLQDGVPSAAEVQTQVHAGPPVRRIAFDSHGMTGWDTGLLTFLTKVIDQSHA